MRNEFEFVVLQRVRKVPGSGMLAHTYQAALGPRTGH
jgi:hypothetical protein